MAKISKIKAKAKDITVEFDEDVHLRCVYRPLAYTVRQMEELAEQANTASGRAPRRVLETIQELLEVWDLEDETGLVPLDEDLDAEDDQGKKTARIYDVPGFIFTQVILAVNEDQRPGGSRASAGS